MTEKTKIFIEKANIVHNEFYGYFNTDYKTAKTKIIVTCPIHGDFEVTPDNHLRGRGCPKCRYIKSSLAQAMTRDEFIEKARKIHGDKYVYSKVDYKNNFTKVCIICPIHGEFWQTPSNHLQGYGCAMCSRNKKSNTKEFIEKAKVVHGDKYIYTEVNYKNNRTKVCIICPEHGEFWQTPHEHLAKQGCPKCAEKRVADSNRLELKEFITRAKEIHGDKYDYSKVEYINNYTKVCIICPIHGEFWQTPMNHLQGKGCKECAKEVITEKQYSYTTESFIKQCKSNHKIDYDYSHVEYKGLMKKIHVVCPTHGDFYPYACNFLRGCECRKCVADINAKKRTKTLEEFISEAEQIHNGLYDYSNFVYVNYKTKSKIKCNKCGREFEQTPNDHLHGRGCPYCNLSKLELEVENTLKKNDIIFIPQFKLDKQHGDFYLPNYNVLIECQGEQHFKPKFTRKGKETSYNFLQSVERDIRKNNKCKEQGIELLYYIPKTIFNETIFTDEQFQKIYNKENVFTNIGELINFIVTQNEIQ